MRVGTASEKGILIDLNETFVELAEFIQDSFGRFSDTCGLLYLAIRSEICVFISSVWIQLKLRWLVRNVPSRWERNINLTTYRRSRTSSKDPTEIGILFIAKKSLFLHFTLQIPQHTCLKLPLPVSCDYLEKIFFSLFPSNANRKKFG